jgi:hypothetical protein
MDAYREEKLDLFEEDRTLLVVRALVSLVADTTDASDTADTKNEGVVVSVADVVRAIKTEEDVEEGAGERKDESPTKHWATPSRVGRMLRRLRLRQERDPGRTRRRYWTTTTGHIVRLAKTYGIRAAGAPSQESSVRSVHNVRSVRAPEESEEETEWSA